MNGKNVYLDSSSIVKRYLEERGSELVDNIYARAEVGTLRISFSIWNVGEFIGALDQYLSRKIVSQTEFSTCLRNFVAETIKLVRLGRLHIQSPTAEIFADTWHLVLSNHVYEADAIQIATARNLGCDLFLSADEKLLEVAEQTQLQAANVETDTKKVITLLEKAKEG